MPIEKLTKAIAARRQLRSAIRMFFDREDTLAIHTITGAVDVLLTDLAEHKGITLVMRAVQEAALNKGLPFSRERLKEILRLDRNFRNKLKHADQKPDEEWEFPAEVNELLLFFSCQHFGQVIAVGDSLVNLFLAWFVLKHQPDFDSDGDIGMGIRAVKKLIRDVDDFEALSKLALGF